MCFSFSLNVIYVIILLWWNLRQCNVLYCSAMYAYTYIYDIFIIYIYIHTLQMVMILGIPMCFFPWCPRSQNMPFFVPPGGLNFRTERVGSHSPGWMGCTACFESQARQPSGDSRPLQLVGGFNVLFFEFESFGPNFMAFKVIWDMHRMQMLVVSCYLLFCSVCMIYSSSISVLSVKL